MTIVRVYFHGKLVQVFDTGDLRLDEADFAALTGAEPKLSRIPPAHWRNVYEYSDVSLVDVEASLAAGHEELAPGIWRAAGKYLSREIAETRALEYLIACSRLAGHGAVRHLRIEKFEGEGP
jgi:hypothetical protein